MIVYNYNPVNLRYVNNTEADADPLQPGKYLIPAHATIIEPPESLLGKVRVFKNNVWEYENDYIIPATTYQEMRLREYPPMAEYLDGIVKGDQAQIDKYIADCLAVKAKYPKPV